MGVAWLPLARVACLTAVALSSARGLNRCQANTWILLRGMDGYFLNISEGKVPRSCRREG